MERVKKIYFPVYDYTVLVIVCDDIPYSRNKRKVDIGHELHNGGENIHALHSFNDNEPRSYLFFYPDANVEIITHETHHCITRLFQWIEGEPCYEIFAYHLGYLSQQVFDFINEKTPTKKKGSN